MLKCISQRDRQVADAVEMVGDNLAKVASELEKNVSVSFFVITYIASFLL